MRRTRIFLSAPYTSPHTGINVRFAMRETNLLLDVGYAVFCPHLSHFLHKMQPRHYDEWMEVDLAWVVAADAVLRLPGDSPGADREVAHAESHRIPVYFSVEELRKHEPAKR